MSCPADSSMMDAQALIILSNIDGIYNGSPADPASEVIREIGQGKTFLHTFRPPSPASAVAEC
mgnify:CR=1 FL=1